MKPSESDDRIMDAIQRGDLDALSKLARQFSAFPSGKDAFLERHWLRNAIDVGTAMVVRWMLENGASARIDDDEGYPPMHAAIERELDYKHLIMHMLIDHGADVNARGINDWTPAHLAAVRNDVEALRILHAANADFNIRTRIDLYATPLVEAKKLGGSPEAVTYLKSIV